jgi:adenylate kinase
MLRENIRSGTSLGQKVSETMRTGSLVSDDLVTNMLYDRIQKTDCANGFVLDGFPRTYEQATQLDSCLLQERTAYALSRLVVFIDLSQHGLSRRLAARRVCPECRKVYGTGEHVPRTPGRCDADGIQLITRDDDCGTTIEQRLRNFELQIRPILAHYAKDGCTLEVDGRRPANEVTSAILEEITWQWRTFVVRR